MSETGWVTLALLAGYPLAAYVVKYLTEFFKPLWDRYAGLPTQYEALVFALGVTVLVAQSAGIFEGVPMWAGVALIGINAVLLTRMANGLHELDRRDLSGAPRNPPGTP